MNTMMQETLLSGTAHKAELPGWMAAGKTGTSQDFRDAWFIGYTSNLVTGVWLGNDDNSPTKKATGGGLPVEIWTRFHESGPSGRAGRGLAGLASRRLVLEPRAGHAANQRGSGQSVAAAGNGRQAGRRRREHRCVRKPQADWTAG